MLDVTRENNMPFWKYRKQNNILKNIFKKKLTHNQIMLNKCNNTD